MELIENLLQLLVTFAGALLSGLSYRRSRTAGVFPAAVLLRLLCPRRALLDAVSAAVRHHAPGLLCVGVRLGGQRYLPADLAGHAGRNRGTRLPLPQGLACACVRRAAAGALLHLRGHPLQPALVRHDGMALLLRHSRAGLCANGQTGAARNMRWFHIGVLCFACLGVPALDGGLLLAGHLPGTAPPSGAICC